jgi:hypothetical protein
VFVMFMRRRLGGKLSFGESAGLKDILMSILRS